MTDTYYRTSDTAEATFLITSGYILKDINYSQPRFEFSFIDCSLIRDLASQYVIGKGLTEPNAFNRINKKLLRVINKRCQWEED